MRVAVHLRAFAAIGVLAACASSARADPAPAVAPALPSTIAPAAQPAVLPAPVVSPDADVQRLADGRSQKKNWVPPSTEDRYGHADVLVHAPLATVKQQVLDFARYKDFVPDRFHNVRILGKNDGAYDVYMQLPIMNGLVTLWQVMKFHDVKPLAPGWGIVEGFFTKGNLKRGNATWTLRRIDDATTLLQFDLLILPLVPAPQSLVDEELRDAAMRAVDAIRDKSQTTPGPVPYAATAPAAPAP